ncbi:MULTISPECIES: hypothetical protein [Mammaliicoccus]|uniref:hypothetical protein n=1 Tax=Mammaliicoccus TaxID=2803850 RepID=UPI001EFA3F08|nr:MULTISPECIES: hypothetical protein [Mammaliicoccus]MEB6201445.1 hypothetical protein [Mammaliicoccus fleurettii]
MQYESNVLISPRLDYRMTNQLKDLSRSLEVPSVRELQALIETIEYDQPFLKSITIGTSNENEMVNAAFHLKSLIESTWYENKQSEVYVNVVIWKNHVGSSKKYVNKFVSNSPDVWITLGSHIGFCNVLKRLYRTEKWDSKRTYCLSSLLSQAMINIVGAKYFEGINGINYHDEIVKVENGYITSNPNCFAESSFF